MWICMIAPCGTDYFSEALTTPYAKITMSWMSLRIPMSHQDLWLKDRG